jgi:hypothetical protein
VKQPTRTAALRAARYLLRDARTLLMWAGAPAAAAQLVARAHGLVMRQRRTRTLKARVGR